jgi:hypothetical protein
MAERITNADIDQALERLTRALAGVGWEKHDYALALRQPYGNLYYVVSYDVTSRNWGIVHDVPGFHGSTAGFLTKRAAYDAIMQTARALWDLMDWSPTRIGQS